MAKLTNCKKCGKEIAKSAKFCTSCGADQRSFLVKNKIFIIIFFLIIGFVSILGSENDNQKGAKIPTESSKPSIVVQAQDVISVFEKNEIKGKQMYTGKVAEITGIVIDVREMFDQVYVLLGSGQDFEITALQCYFEDQEQINKLAEVCPGQRITLVGTIGEQLIWHIDVHDCRLK